MGSEYDEEIQALQSIFEETDVFYFNSNKQTCKLFIPIETENLSSKLKYLHQTFHKN